MDLSDVLLQPNRDIPQIRVERGRGCMKCTERQMVTKFTDLGEGDHIEMRGNIRCCNNRSVYSHHAIVDSIRPAMSDIRKANVSLFGIPDTGGKIRQETRDLDLERDKVRRIEYNKRKFNQKQTKERAMSVANRDMKVPYRLFTRNCENFATICVIGNDEIDENLSDSATQQGRAFFFGLFNCICLGSRFIGSLLSFFLYFLFVAGDNIIDIIPKSSASLFAKVCKFNTSTSVGAQEHRICHLKVQSIFVSAYLLYVVLSACLTCSAQYVCKRCKVKSLLILFSRFFLYLILEGILIWTEAMVFGRIKQSVILETKGRIELRQFILVVIALVKSAIECIIIYWIANGIASFIPRYLVKKKPIYGTALQIGDVISWKRDTCGCSVDAIVIKTYASDDNQVTKLNLIYEDCCSWTMFCTKVIKQTDVLVDDECMRTYDFSDFSHKFTPQEVVNNAEREFARGKTHCGLVCCNRSSGFCYSAKVKDISCQDRFNSCERCFRCVCCL